MMLLPAGANVRVHIAAGNGADGMQHHTSWVNSGTGILALDLNGDGRIGDITETLSEYFAGGPTPYN